MMLGWIILIHVMLCAACVVYAMFLNQRHVYEWYNPNRTWITVVIGDTLIGIALAMVCAIGALPWLVLLFYSTLHIAAGLPIIIWQFQRADARARTLEALDKEDG